VAHDPGLSGGQKPDVAAAASECVLIDLGLIGALIGVRCVSMATKPTSQNNAMCQEETLVATPDMFADLGCKRKKAIGGW
jgi:hypothetical protein